jgi:hypothetical protein
MSQVPVHHKVTQHPDSSIAVTSFKSLSLSIQMSKGAEKDAHEKFLWAELRTGAHHFKSHSTQQTQ